MGRNVLQYYRASAYESVFSYLHAVRKHGANADARKRANLHVTTGGDSREYARVRFHFRIVIQRRLSVDDAIFAHPAARIDNRTSENQCTLIDFCTFRDGAHGMDDAYQLKIRSQSFYFLVD